MDKLNSSVLRTAYICSSKHATNTKHAGKEETK